MLRAMDLVEEVRNLAINLFVTFASLALAASLVRKRWPCLVTAHWIGDVNGGRGRRGFHGNAIEKDSCPLPMPPIWLRLSIIWAYDVIGLNMASEFPHFSS